MRGSAPHFVSGRSAATTAQALIDALSAALKSSARRNIVAMVAGERRESIANSNAAMAVTWAADIEDPEAKS